VIRAIVSPRRTSCIRPERVSAPSDARLPVAVTAPCPRTIDDRTSSAPPTFGQEAGAEILLQQGGLPQSPGTVCVDRRQKVGRPEPGQSSPSAPRFPPLHIRPGCGLQDVRSTLIFHAGAPGAISANPPEKLCPAKSTLSRWRCRHSLAGIRGSRTLSSEISWKLSESERPWPSEFFLREPGMAGRAFPGTDRCSFPHTARFGITSSFPGKSQGNSKRHSSRGPRAERTHISLVLSPPRRLPEIASRLTLREEARSAWKPGAAYGTHARDRGPTSKWEGDKHADMGMPSRTAEASASPGLMMWNHDRRVISYRRLDRLLSCVNSSPLKSQCPQQRDAVSVLVLSLGVAFSLQA
jgi:hypothetical protein